MSNEEILNYATQHELPIFVSIDGSLNNESATVCVSIIAPDIQPTDTMNKWQNRAAKVFLTDSNNACTLQQNARFKNKFTHRKMIRQVKQGINHAMANHLEYLTDKWPREEQLTRYTLELYKRGEEICKFWAKQIQDKLDTFSPFEHTHDETDSITSWESDTVSLESMSSISTSPTHSPTTSKNTFDSSMYDCLGRIIVIKVTSHQLHPDFTISSTTKGPIPNMFISLANQITL